MQHYGDSLYKQTDIITADRGKLVVLLYEGAINYLISAKKSIQEGDIEGKCNSVTRAMDIVQELNYSLKMQEGGTIATNLRRLYWFMEKHLIKAKIERQSTRKIDEVISILSELCEAWREILEKPEVKVVRETDGTNHPGLSRGISA
jgi:flagellar protein FliS